MASLGMKFNATEHDTTQRDFAGELPNGIFKLEIDTSEVKETSKGTGTYLATTVVVLEPEEYKGRKIFNNNYNLQNDNPQAEEIGKKQFASLCRAIGVSEVDDSEELHFRPFYAKVGRGKPSVGKDGKNYPGRAEIKKYFFPTDDNGNDIDPPEVGIDAIQPEEGAPAPANDNRQAAAPAQRQAAAPAAAAGGARPSRPWGQPK